MEKKNKKQVESVNPGTALAIIEKPQERVEEQTLTLQQEIEKRAEELQMCLAELEKKKLLSSNRNTFLTVLDQLEEAEDKLLTDDSFDTTLFKLKFCELKGYRDEDVFSVGNREIMLRFVRFIRVEVTQKIRNIEQQLIE